MSKKDRTKKRTARVAAENARKETVAMVKRIKKEKDQFGWQPEKVN